MVYLLQYRGDPPAEAGRRVRIALDIWRKRRGEPRPNLLIVPPDEVEDFQEVAEQQNLTLKADPEFKKRHGDYHFALDLKKN